MLGGYSLVVEPQPSKLMMRVRFPLPAPSFVGSTMRFALVAQLVEHTLGKGEVSGSNPLKSSINKGRYESICLCFKRLVRFGVSASSLGCNQSLAVIR
jgi:hypothetical protein